MGAELPEGAWARLYAAWPYGDRLLVTAVGSVLHAVTLWGFCWFFIALDRLGVWAQHKISRDAPHLKHDASKDALDKRAIKEQIFGTFVVVPVFIFLTAPWLVAAGIEVAPQADDWAKCAWDVCALIVACDTLFYWVHRLLHVPPLYGWFHKQHHEYKASTVWASEYFGIFDMVCNILPGVLPAIFVQPHFATLMLFTALRQWQTVQSHAGYNLPYDPLNCGVFKDGASRHDHHHSRNRGCYGDWMPFWDWLCGTDKDFRKLAQRDAAT